MPFFLWLGVHGSKSGRTLLSRPQFRNRSEVRRPLSRRSVLMRVCGQSPAATSGVSEGLTGDSPERLPLLTLLTFHHPVFSSERLANHRAATSPGEDPASGSSECPLYSCAETPKRWPELRLAEHTAACPALALGSDLADKTTAKNWRSRYIYQIHTLALCVCRFPKRSLICQNR